MRKIILFFVIIILIFNLFSLYFFCKKNEYNKILSQTKFEMFLLEILDKQGKDTAGKLLAGDIQRMIIIFLDNRVL